MTALPEQAPERARLISPRLTSPEKARGLEPFRTALMGSFAFALSLGALSAGGATIGALSLGSAVLLPSVAWADEPAPAPSDGDHGATEQAAAAPATPASKLPPDEIERQAEAIARSIMSPFCPGRTVSACPNAGPWREDIRRWTAEGVDADEIKKRLAERVPEHNLAGVPKNRLGWVLPVGLAVLALGVLVFLLRYLVKPGAAGTAAAGAPAAAGAAPDAAEPVARKAGTATSASRANGEDYDARLEQELDTLEQ